MNYGTGRSVPIWARVKMFVEMDVLLAARDIARIATIVDSDVTTEKRRIFPIGGLAGADARNVIGKRTKRGLKKGDPITAAMLENPKEVERGDKVDVAVSSGAAQLRLDAVAESSGQIGERVLVRNPASGKRFQATVESKGHVSVTALTEEHK